MDAKELANPQNLEKAQVYVDFVKNNLEPLADHLKVSVEWLWDILVMQARVEAITYLIIVILLFVKSALLLFVAYKSYKKATFYGKDIYKNKKGETVSEQEYYADYDDKIKRYRINTNLQGYMVYWCGIGGMCLMIISSIVAACSTPIIVTGLVNPKFRAIEKIVEYAKPTVNDSQKEN